jgi:predicted CopG family antitoxin
MHTHMSSKNVAIQRAVYDSLAREKRTGESFTELLARLLAQRGAAEELRGAWGTRGLAEDTRRLMHLRQGKRGRAA